MKIDKHVRSFLTGRALDDLVASRETPYRSATVYDYPAVLADPADVHDGDTFWLHIGVAYDFGFHIVTSDTARLKFRLYGCNAPELSTQAGIDAKAFALVWLQAHAATLRVISHGPDNYGDRWDGEVYDVESGERLADVMIAAGQAVPMKRGKMTP